MRIEIVSQNQSGRFKCCMKYNVTVDRITCIPDNFLTCVKNILFLHIDEPSENYKLGFQIETNGDEIRPTLDVPFMAEIENADIFFIRRLKKISQSAKKFLNFTEPVKMCISVFLERPKV